MIWASLAILVTASPKVSPFDAAFGWESFWASLRMRYSSFKRARRLLAASELAFMRSIVAWECWFGFFIRFHQWPGNRNNRTRWIEALRLSGAFIFCEVRSG